MGHANAYNFINEHPDSINFGDLAVAMNDGVAESRVYIIDYPASNHNGAGTLSFADGHAEAQVAWMNAPRLPSRTGPCPRRAIAGQQGHDLSFKQGLRGREVTGNRNRRAWPSGIGLAGVRGFGECSAPLISFMLHRITFPCCCSG